MEFIGEFDDVGDLVWEEDEGACEDGMFLLEALECEGCDDAEVCACAADSPEQVGVLAR